MIVNKLKSKTLIVDIAVFVDFGVRKKKLEKVWKYQDLALKVIQMWKTTALGHPYHSKSSWYHTSGD